MSFCSNCGNQLLDGQSFCPSCGNGVGQVPPAHQQSASVVDMDKIKTGAGSFLGIISPKGTLSKNPVISELRKQGSSYFFIAFLLFYSFLTLLYFINIFSRNLGILSSILESFDSLSSSALSSFGLGSYGFNITGMIEGYLHNSIIGKLMSFTKFISFIPFGLICYGLWDFYISCINKKKDIVHAKGLKLIGTLYGIRFIVAVVLCALIEIGLLINMFASFGRQGAGALLMIFANIIVGIFYGVQIFFYSRIKKAINNIAETGATGIFNGNSLIPKTVIAFIGISIIGSFFTGPTGPIKFFTTASLILLIIIILRYNSHMPAKMAAPFVDAQAEQAQ